jgi:hypothetical protein
MKLLLSVFVIVDLFSGEMQPSHIGVADLAFRRGKYSQPVIKRACCMVNVVVCNDTNDSPMMIIFSALL